ncbi:MAG: hypothetical protein ABSC92_08890 [Rhizomicrobium sp.]|jgi:hypothetical protein
MAKLNIFTCADSKYEDFAPIFIGACLWSNPEATVEVGVEDALRFADVHGQAMSILASAHGDQSFLIRNASWRGVGKRRIRPGTVRFITEPMLPSDYVYISDIDIVTLEPEIANRHIAFMKRTGLPYSNWVRTGYKRLTGLHFSRRDWQYPLPKYDDFALSTMPDENLLYMLVRRKLGFDPPIGEKFRPVHGIHMSPNRAPGGSVKKGLVRPGWLVKPHSESWHRFRSTRTFHDLEPHLSERIKTFVARIDELAAVDLHDGSNAADLGLDS